jgi:hypothetical protein
MTRDTLLRLCTINVCWRSEHVAPPVEVAVGEVEGELEVGAVLPDPVLDDEPDVDVPVINDATGGPGKIY